MIDLVGKVKTLLTQVGLIKSDTAAILTAVTGGASDARFQQSDVGPIERNALEDFSISIYDINSGAVLLANINISGITAVLEKSTGGAAFSNAGITQPTFLKSDGKVYVAYQFLTAQWAIGDFYRLTVSGITATVDSTLVYVPTMIWSNGVTDTADVKNIYDVVKSGGTGDLVALKAVTPASTIAAATDIPAMRGTDNAMLAANGALEATLTAIKGGTWSTQTLVALASAIAAIPTTAMRGTDGAALASAWTSSLATALGSYTAALATALGNYTSTRAGYIDTIADGTNGLAAIKTAVNAIPTTAMRGTDSAALATYWTQALATALGNYTATRAGYIDNLSGGAVALASKCDAKSSDIKTKTDKITNARYTQIDKSAASDMIFSLLFSTLANDRDFPNVRMMALPTGATITRVRWGFSYSRLVDTSGTTNGVDEENKTVRAKISTGAWGINDIVAYTFAFGALYAAGSETSGGNLIMGSEDMKSIVTGAAATYNFESNETERANSVIAAGDDLIIFNVESWMITEYTL